MQLVIFDIDGTLVDSQDLIVGAQEAAFAAVGLRPPSRERSLSIVGLSLPEAFTTLVGPNGPIEALLAAYREVYPGMRADPKLASPLFPGAAEVLDALSRRRDVRLGIATGKNRRGTAYVIERFGWKDIFATVQTADDAPSKPDPGMIRNAMAETGIGPEATTMIGDTSFDMAMAVGAGVRPIGVSWGYHPVAALREAGADTLIERFEDLLPLLLGEPAAPAHA